MRVFISYRREDSAGYTGRLYDHLIAQFGDKQVFMDIDTIKPGQDFVDIIEDAVSNCDALIAVIGKNWLTMTDDDGQRRLDNPLDFVRIEVAKALERDKLIIPVLVDNAKMPRPDDLPDNMKKLARRNALPISHDRFRYDIGRLIETLNTPSTPIKSDEAVIITGLWIDPVTSVQVYFMQKNQRVVGFYTMTDKTLGAYVGELIGHVFEFHWRWLNQAMSGHGRVIIASNRKTLTGHYWIGNDEEHPSTIRFEWAGNDTPDWVNESDFKSFAGFLEGK